MRLPRLQIGLFLVCLLALPFLAAADPTDPTGLFLRAGKIEIAFDPAQPSFLPVDTEALRQGLCTGFPDLDGERPPIIPAGECEMVVRSPPGLDLWTDGASSSGSLRVTVRPTALPAWEGETQIVTPCGVWSVSMALDPDQQQPVSELALEPSAEDPTQGVFASAVRLAVLFHVADPAKGVALDLPADVPLDLAGRWAAVPAKRGLAGLADSASNLVLFGGFFAGSWSSVPGTGMWGSRRCPVHLVLPSFVLDNLNQSIH